MQRTVLEVVEATFAGVGRHALDITEGLVSAGWNVHLVYSPLRMSSSFRDRLSSLRGVTAKAIPIAAAIHLSDFPALVRIVQYVGRPARFDLVHGHSSKGGALARLAGLLTGVPTVYTPNAFVTMNPQLSPWRYRLYGTLESLLSKAATRTIAVSAEERAHGIALGIPPHTIVEVPNGVAPYNAATRREVRARLGISNDVPVLGFVGRLSSQKAPDILLRAFAQVVRHVPASLLVIVGDGPMQSELRRLSDDLAIRGRIHWLGELDGQGVMPAFDLLVLTSRYEGMPYVLIEAASLGIPVVATRVGGASSVICDGENGRLVRLADITGLANTIVDLLRDEPLRNSYSKASLERRDKWDVRRMIERTIAVYEDAVRHGLQRKRDNAESLASTHGI